MTTTKTSGQGRLRYMIISLCTLLVFSLGTAALSWAQTQKASSETQTEKQLKLVNAVMCEGIQEYAPINPAVVFSIGLGRVSCFTFFDPVPKETFIYHSWFRRDVLITTKRLKVRVPRWGTFSSVQLRQADKGPWRVEVHDKDGNILQTLRFSITD